MSSDTMTPEEILAEIYLHQFNFGVDIKNVPSGLPKDLADELNMPGVSIDVVTRLKNDQENFKKLLPRLSEETIRKLPLDLKSIACMNDRQLEVVDREVDNYVNRDDLFNISTPFVQAKLLRYDLEYADCLGKYADEGHCPLDVQEAAMDLLFEHGAILGDTEIVEGVILDFRLQKELAHVRPMFISWNKDLDWAVKKIAASSPNLCCCRSEDEQDRMCYVMNKLPWEIKLELVCNQPNIIKFSREFQLRKEESRKLCIAAMRNHFDILACNAAIETHFKLYETFIVPDLEEDTAHLDNELFKLYLNRLGSRRFRYVLKGIASVVDIPSQFQLQLVRRNKDTIEYISMPTEEVQKHIVTEAPDNITKIKKILPNIETMIAQEHPAKIVELPNPSEDALRIAIMQQPELIVSVNNPSDNLIQIAVETYALSKV